MNQLSLRDQRRNFKLGVLNGAVFRIADVFIDPEMVFTWFLMQLGISNFLIGLVTPIRFGASFLLQLLVAGHLERKPYKLPFYRTVSIFRCGVLLSFAVFITLVPAQKTWLTIAFFAELTIYSLGAGLVAIPFMDVVGKVIPPRRRGAFFSQRSFWGGILALGGSWVVGFVLSEPAGLHFPLNVALLFGLATVLYAVTAGAWSLIKEPPSPVVSERVSGRVQFRRGLQIFKDNAAYRAYVWVRMCMLFAQWAAPFYVVYARTTLNIPAHMLGLYLGARTSAMILSNLIWGRMSDRHGNRRLLVTSTVLGLVMPLAALLISWLHQPHMGTSTWPAYAFAVVFIASGAFNAGSMIGLTGYLLDVAPEKERPLYLAFNNTLFGLLRFSSLLGGLIVDGVGFVILFLFSILCFGLALMLAILMKEPRHTAL